MKRTVQTAGIIIALLYASAIVWLYLRQPRTFEEIKTQAAVEANLYQINQENFDEALKHFNAGQHRLAVEQFEVADPARRDPKTQFYIAYCYYLLGRGRLSDDDEIFAAGLAAIERAIAAAPNGIFEIDRADLEIRSAASLRQRLKEGLEVTSSDFNPLNWFKKD